MTPDVKKPPPPPYTPTRADTVTALDTSTPLGRASMVSTGSPTGLQRKATTRKASLIGGGY